MGPIESQLCAAIAEEMTPSAVEVGLPADHGYNGPVKLKLMALYKYKLGDTLFILNNNEVDTFKVEKVQISIFPNGDEVVEYTCFERDSDNDIVWRREENCFATKAELLASL